MNTHPIALACALTAIACGSSSTQPAHEANTDTAATVTDQGRTATVSQPDTSTPQPTATTTDSTVGATTTDDRKRTGASQYVVANAAPPAVNASPVVADEPKNADNTKKNVRDRNDTLTPMDQGNSAAETKITASIRKGIMGDKGVSFSGKNVKIVTIGTKVTLRGPVKSELERSTIEGIATRTAGVSLVDNQLEVAK